MQLDALAFAAHPDDIELSCGGTLISLSEKGYKTGAITLTRGEMGTRGTPDIRKKEFEQAGKIMGLAVHGSLDIPDSNVSITQENKLKIIKEIRKYKPTVVFAPYWVVRHPDHGHCSHVVREAAYFAGLKKIDTGQEPYRPRKIIFYALRYEFTPSFIVDISHVYERKLEAIAAYKSQFYRADVLSDAENNVLISSPEFLDFITTRAKYWGGKIGVKYAEPFLVREPIRIDDPVQLFERITLV